MADLHTVTIGRSRSRTLGAGRKGQNTRRQLERAMAEMVSTEQRDREKQHQDRGNGMIRRE